MAALSGSLTRPCGSRSWRTDFHRLSAPNLLSMNQRPNSKSNHGSADQNKRNEIPWSLPLSSTVPRYDSEHEEETSPIIGTHSKPRLSSGVCATPRSSIAIVSSKDICSCGRGRPSLRPSGQRNRMSVSLRAGAPCRDCMLVVRVFLLNDQLEIGLSDRCWIDSETLGLLQAE